MGTGGRFPLYHSAQNQGPAREFHRKRGPACWVGIWYLPDFPGSLHFVFQLTAGSVNVASARIADGGFLACAS